MEVAIFALYCHPSTLKNTAWLQWCRYVLPYIVRKHHTATLSSLSISCELWYWSSVLFSGKSILNLKENRAIKLFKCLFWNCGIVIPTLGQGGIVANYYLSSGINIIHNYFCWCKSDNKFGVLDFFSHILSVTAEMYLWWKLHTYHLFK